jgi:tRNA(Ile)-lysidine synthase
VRRFDAYCRQHQLLSQQDHILAAVSGGMDSMTMLYALLGKGYRVSIAHCNFSLRQEESDDDQTLVESYAAQRGIPCYVKKFNTAQYAAANHLSIEMAARTLRYEWFAQVAAAAACTKIAIAHNADDSIETFLLNLTRSTGLQGLTGIAPKRGMLVRPLLFAHRSVIAHYAKEHAIPYREDSTNALPLHRRNQIRLQILPALKAIDPAFPAAMRHSIEYISQAAAICKEQAQIVKNAAVECKDMLINVKLSQIPPQHLLFYLHEILGEYGFAGNAIHKIAQACKGCSGKLFRSRSHELVVDRQRLVVRRSAQSAAPHDAGITEDALGAPIALPPDACIMCEVIEPCQADFSHGEDWAFLDYDMLEFPLTMRHAQAGDSFVPLGMQGVKKISDFYTDLKLNLFQKHARWLLLSGGKVAWIVGLRIDHRYRITAHTRRVLALKIVPLQHS